MLKLIHKLHRIVVAHNAKMLVVLTDLLYL